MVGIGSGHTVACWRRGEQESTHLCDGEKCTVLLSYVAEPYQLRTAPVYVAEPYQLRTVACLSGGAVPAPHSHLSILALYSL